MRTPTSTSISIRRSLRALDLVNLFQADVGAGLGPFLAIYLMASRGWKPEMIGLALAAEGYAAVAAQTPAGALVDWIRPKRMAIAVAAIVIGMAAIAIVRVSGVAPVLSAQVLIGVVSVVIPPAIAAISLGVVGRRGFARRAGRNEAFNHAGNLMAAFTCGAVGYLFSRGWIFYMAAVISCLTAVAALAINENDIDHALAREAPSENQEELAATPLRRLLRDYRIAVFSACAILFHFANAAMLPLLGMRLSAGHAHESTIYMSACIVIAQLVMVVVAPLAGDLAPRWGRKPVLMIGFAALPIRGVLYTLTNDPYLLVSIQILDGVGAGIWGVLWVIIAADLARGTGRFNLLQGLIATGVAIGASSSNLTTGFVAQHFGYDVGFLVLAAIAAGGFATLSLAMPETMHVSAPSVPFRVQSGKL
ncbi:MAG: MFS transporter [Deltaproteobacteria bacterium]|nr:MFS transporter [Deltaproteobacteria bacterium]